MLTRRPGNLYLLPGLEAISMGILLGGFIVLVLIGALISLLEKGIESNFLRPIIGLFIISALVAGLGLILSLVFSDIETWFFIVAKGIAVFAAVLLCLRLMGVVGQRFFSR